MKFSPKHSWQQSFREVGPYLDLGMRMALSLVLGVFGGLWLDRKIHTTPLFLIIGFFLGAITGFWSIYRTVYLKNQKKQDRDSNE